jgi:hypothetical protein
MTTVHGEKRRIQILKGNGKEGRSSKGEEEIKE